MTRWEIRDGRSGVVLASLHGTHFNKTTATRVAHYIADTTGVPVTAPTLKTGPIGNPTLVHHGKAASARWHIVSAKEQVPLADLYNLGPHQASRIAHRIADETRVPMLLLSNFGLPKTIAEHSILRTASGSIEHRPRARTMNPIRRGIDPRSIRTVGRGPKRVLVGCPTGKYSPRAGRCRVGTRSVNPRPGFAGYNLNNDPIFSLNDGTPVLARGDRRHPRVFVNRSQAEKVWHQLANDGDFELYQPRMGPAFYLRYVGPDANQLRGARHNPKRKGRIRGFSLTSNRAGGPGFLSMTRTLKRRNARGDAKPIWDGKYLLEDEGVKDYPNLGRVRSFTATGKRGAVYGCLVYPDGRWHWMNLSRRLSTVPFDLAQVNPASYFGAVSNPARSKAARRGRTAKRRAYGSSRARRAADARARAMRAGGSGRSELARFGRIIGRGRRANPRGHNLSVPERHQLKIARDTLKLSEAGALIMGGMTKAEAREVILRLTGKPPIENRRASGAGRGRKLTRSTTRGGRRNPRAPFVAGEQVSVPYTGRISYFGRKVRRTREKATVQGYAVDGTVHVLVRRGRSSESHHFPEDAVRRLPKRGPGAVRSRTASVKARIELKALRASRNESLVSAAAARHERECAEAQAKAISPVMGEPPSPEYNRLLARIRKLSREIDAHESIATELERQDPKYVDPWALPQPARMVASNRRQGRNAAGHRMARPVVRRKARRNPRESEVARARRTATMWNEFEPTTARRVKAPRRIPRVLAGLGKVRSIVYDSEKYAGSRDNPTGKAQLYEHKFKRPYPELASDGKDVFLVGGRTKVTADGLVN